MWWWRRRGALKGLDDDIRDHIAQETEENAARGMTPGEARRQALLKFGSPSLAQEDTRATWGWLWLEQGLQDFRRAFRALHLRPGFSTAVVITLGLAVGITTAMFAVVDALLIRPLPFPASDRLVQFYMGTKRGGRLTVSPAVLTAWRETPVFTSVEGMDTMASVIEVDGNVLTTNRAHVTPGLFRMLGIQPVKGRLFQAAEGGGSTILISESLWRSVLGADPEAIGRRLTLDGESFVVVGILPEQFRFPAWNTQAWTAADYGPNAPRTLMAALRLAPNVTEAEALAIATDRAHEADRTTSRLEAVQVPLVRTGPSSSYRTAVAMLFGFVVLVFVVLCVNASSLLLGQFTARRYQFSLSAALGASRGRLLRQALVETGGLGVIGGAVGTALAWTLVAVARNTLPEAFLARTLNPLDLDSRALAIALGSAGVAIVGAGLLPAVIGTRRIPASSLRLTERAASEPRGAQLLTRTFLIGEITLACALLVGATVLVRSFVNLASVDRGFDPRGIVAVNINMAGALLRPMTAAKQAALTEEERAARGLASVGISNQSISTTRAAIEDAVRGLPGVQRVEWSNGGPMTDASSSYFGPWRTDLAGTPLVDAEVEVSHVGPRFFEMYGIRLLSGRPAENSGEVVIGERLASALFPGIDPIGHSFRRPSQSENFQVVGVAVETNRPSLDPALDNPEFYLPLDLAFVPRTLNLRCAGSCPSEAQLRQRLVEASPLLAVTSVRRLDEVYAQDLAQPRATAMLALTFGGIALLAASVGLFSALNHTVGRRRREFGIRLALGSSPGQVLRAVLREGVILALIGVALGALVGWFLMRALATLQYGVPPGDPLTWTVVVTVLLGTSVAASWRPARQAMLTDPAVLLREE